jgi:hypothetical protein
VSRQSDGTAESRLVNVAFSMVGVVAGAAVGYAIGGAELAFALGVGALVADLGTAYLRRRRETSTD